VYILKIGEFAKANKTTIDTIRHYMEMSILNPDKNGNYYDFDDHAQKDYETIVALKELGFSISEIQTLMLFERIGKYTGYNQRKTYKAFYKNKLGWIHGELNRLKTMQEKLEDAIDALPDHNEEDSRVAGAPLDALSLLFCKKCQQAYRLIDGHVDQGEVLNGIMTCSCGERLVIHEGIVYGEGALNSSEAFVFDDTFIEDYVQTTHIDYLKNLHLTLQWARKHSIFENPDKGSVLELGSGRGFFLRNMIEMIPKQSVYIAVDHNPNAHQWLKKDLATAGENLKILYLCCDFKAIPLQDHSIDYLIDATGSTNYAFDHCDFLLDSIMHLLKQTCLYQGHFLFFENFSLNTLIPKDRRQWFQKEGIQHELSKLGFKCMRNYETQLISEGGPGEDFFVEGEKIYNYLYIGKL
jgi:DNA-binding transcriptional MerR regulator/SAM-dependent methyltransferase